LICETISSATAAEAFSDGEPFLVISAGKSFLISSFSYFSCFAFFAASFSAS
jgi:hypothetical protein